VSGGVLEVLIKGVLVVKIGFTPPIGNTFLTFFPLYPPPLPRVSLPYNYLLCILL